VRGKFLNDVPASPPAWLRRVAVPAVSRGGGPVMVPVVDDAKSLLWLVRRGVVELHATLHRVDAPGQADSVLFDLDPTPHANVRDASRVALLLYEALASVGLQSFVKTSGGRGLHIAVPITRGPGYDATRAFARAVARALARAVPELVSSRTG
jgi:bifunctional non-homologous end joining protein LigD